MLVRASTYVADTSRYQGPGLFTILGILLVGYLGIAGGFYWLMQPTVVKNNGVAAYRPPPATAVSALPYVPPAPSEVARAEPLLPFAESPAAAPKKEVAKPRQIKVQVS